MRVAGEHATIHRDPHAYCAHPQLAALPNGDRLVVFNRTFRRPPILHPPEDPFFHNVVVRSRDGGASWSEPSMVPAFNWHGTECASLTPLSDGRILLNQWRFDWYPLGLARRLPARLGLRFPEHWAAAHAASPEHDVDPASVARAAEAMPWARGGGRTFVHLSGDGGESWTETHEIDVAPYSGGYGMRGALELPDGDLLLPLSDVPHYRSVFVLRSSDGGRGWGPPVEAASAAGKEFEEPSLLRLPSGRLLLMLRENAGRRLHSCVSDDGGRSWSAPAPTGIPGYPPHLLLLPGGGVLCTVGWREPPYGIRAVLSADGGASWDLDAMAVVRDGLPSRNLGYPCSMLEADGSLFTVYYGEDAEGVTTIQSTRWGLPS
jgi:hypothetical protein